MTDERFFRAYELASPFVQRLARAGYRFHHMGNAATDSEPDEADADRFFDSWAPARDQWAANVRAILTAMRSGSPEILHAMTMVAPTWDDDISLAKWQAAIDTVLNGP